MSNFFNELKNRNVYKAATAYVVTGWLIMQVVDTMSNNLSWPPEIASWITKILIVGFPITLVITWLYEVTPQGLKRTGAVQEDTADNRKAGKRLNHLIIGALAITICFMLVERIFFAGNTSINKRQEASIAVLPFANISLTNEDENFALGLTEQILNDLSSVSGLRVISANSSFIYREKNLNDQEIANELKVNYLLKGSLQYDNRNNRVKIITRLVNPYDGENLWSDAYEDDFIEIFGIQEDVSRKVVSQLQVKLLPNEEEFLGTKITSNEEALKLYLKSRNFSKKRNDRDLGKAIELLQKAVKLEPNFAEAHAELSFLYGQRYFYGNLSKESRNELMKYHLDKAIEIAPETPEVLWAKARYYVPSPKDSGLVISNLKKVIALRPNFADAQYHLALAFHRARKYESALKYMEEAVKRDPNNDFLGVQFADFNYMYGNIEKGIQLMGEVINRDSSIGAMRRKALMAAKAPYGDMVEAFKLIHYGDKKDEYDKGNLNYHLLFALDLDLWPVSEKYSRLLQMRYPENLSSFHGPMRLYTFKKEYPLKEELINLWASEKGLDSQTAALERADIQIELGNYQEALKIYEEAYPYMSEDNMDADSLDYGTKYNDLWNYVEILRFNHDDGRADILAKKLCKFYTDQSSTNEYLPVREANIMQMDCYYLSNDTIGFIKALEERFFTKKDRLDIFSELKMGVYRRFYKNEAFQELFARITEETHRQRAEVIEYLKEEGDWDPAWDEELGLE